MKQASTVFVLWCSFAVSLIASTANSSLNTTTNASCAPTTSPNCRPEICFNSTVGLWPYDSLNRSLPVSHISNTTDYPSREYDSCLENAGGIVAFRCRCTPYYFDCLIKRAGCNVREAREPCRRFLTDTAKNTCARKLCRKSDCSSFGLWCGLAFSLIVGVVL